MNSIRANNSRPLHAKPSQIILTAEEENRQILSVADFVEFYGITHSYARKMISKLVGHGWLIRVGRGKYQLLPARTGLDPCPMGDKFVVACQAFPRSFIAYGSAAEYHGLSLQTFQTVLLANTERSGERSIGDTRIRLIKIDPSSYMGYETLNRGPNVQIATVERTIIDCIDHPDLAGGISDMPEILRRGRSRASVERIVKYVQQYGSKSLIKKVGYLLEAFTYQLTASQERKLLKWSAGIKTYLFSPRLPGTSDYVEYSSKWGLIINAPGFAVPVKEELK